MQAAALGYYTAHLTRSAGWSALVAAGEFAPTAVLGPIGGALADRLSRRTVMIITSIAQAGLAVAMTAVMVVGRPQAPVLALYALANGCVFALGFPSFSALLPELVPPEEIGAAVGLSSASWNLGRVVGPLAGTLLYQVAGISWVLGLNGASFLAVVLSLLTIHPAERERTRSPLFAAIADGFRFVVDEPGLRVTLLALCLNSLFIAPFIGLIPVMVENELGGGKGAVGWLITGQGLGAVFTGVVFGSLSARFGVRRIMVGALTLAPIALILYAASPTWWVAVGPIVALGSLYFFALSSFTTVANLRAPSELRGRVLSLNQVVLGSVYAVSLNVEGQLGDRLGLRRVLIGGALISLFVLVVVRIVWPGCSAAVSEPGLESAVVEVPKPVNG
jgi:MFS family permease